jgi:hypothetical protein
MNRIPTTKVGPLARIGVRNRDASTNELATAIAATSTPMDPAIVEVTHTPKECVRCCHKGLSYHRFDPRDLECGVTAHDPYWYCDECYCQMVDCTGK